jgi:hypothetical protein
MMAFAASPACRRQGREGAAVFSPVDANGAGAGGRQPEGSLRFLEWLLCDYAPSRRDGTLLGRLADEATELPPSEASLLLALFLSPVRAYEVGEILGPQGVMLKDILVGSERRAGPFGLPRELIRSDILIGRLCHVGRLWRPGPTMMRLAAPARGELLAYARTVYQMARPGRHVSLEDFLDGSPELYHHFFQLRGGSLAGREICTVRSEAYAPGRVRLEGVDSVHIRAVLERQPDLEPVEGPAQGQYAWIRADDGVCRATVGQDERGVEIRADTRADLAEASRILSRALQGLVQERPAEELPAQTHSTPGDDGAEEPTGTAFLRRTFASWAETTQPLLSDRTPAEACRLQTGRLEVAALLTEIERDLARHKRLGRAWVDLGPLRDSLGAAEPPVFTAPRSGADRGSAGAAVHPAKRQDPKRRGSGEHRTPRFRK